MTEEENQNLVEVFNALNKRIISRTQDFLKLVQNDMTDLVNAYIAKHKQEEPKE